MDQIDKDLNAFLNAMDVIEIAEVLRYYFESWTNNPELHPDIIECDDNDRCTLHAEIGALRKDFDGWWKGWYESQPKSSHPEKEEIWTMLLRLLKDFENKQ